MQGLIDAIPKEKPKVSPLFNAYVYNGFILKYIRMKI